MVQEFCILEYHTGVLHVRSLIPLGYVRGREDKMSMHKIDLSDNEEVVFESSPAVLTTHRLLANWKNDDGHPSDEA